MSSTIVNLTALIAASILLQLSTGTLVVVGISGSTATLNNDGSSVGVAQVGDEKLGLTSGDDTRGLLKIISSRLDQIEIQLGLAHPDRVCHGFGKAADDRCTRVGNGGGSGGNRIGVEMEDNQDGDAADDDYRAPDLDGSPSRVGQRRRRRHQAGRLEQRRDRSLQGGRRPARSPRGGGEPVAGGRAGLDGRPGVDGAPGLDGVPGVDGRNGRDGLDGRDGKDGKDGQPGERGPIGPPGPPGEAGRRGKSGPPGRPGLPGPPGVCVHRAKFDCAKLTTASSNSSSEPLEALLMAPTMIGSQESDSLAGLRRQVSVSEGETIQLTCEAFGLPKPKYVWRRLDSRKSILQTETSSGQLMRLTSFQGAQLPLDQVDRTHMGTYECLASNGVPPEAQKRINLDVNYKPTIRIYPGPSIYRVPLGSSLTVECLVESNPSPFSYWTFGSQSIMATAPPAENKLEQLQAPSKGKYVVMESAGQLANGATYTLLSLNITRIEPNDLGLYKCISKNLIGQTMGYFWLLESESTPMSVMVAGQADDIKDMMELTLTNTRPFHQLDLELGWPSELVRLHINYSVFGDELRPLRRQWRAGTVDSQPPAAVQILPSSQANETREPIVNNNQLATFVAFNQLEGSRDDEADLGFDEHSSDDELCHVEKPQTIIQELYLGGRHSKDSSQVLLLDQLGKQVYLGSGPVNWWSMDSMLEDKNGFYYATFPNQSSRLFEYKSLEDLLAEGQRHDLDQTRAQRSYRLEYPLSGSSHLVYNGLFLYQTTGNESDLMVVVLELNGGRQRLLRLAEMMRSQLSLEQKLDRVEMMADENGVWLVVPTLNRRRRLDAPVRNDMIEGGTWTRSRRLNVFKLRLESLLTIVGDHDADRTGDHVNKLLDNLVEYHVSMRLDWRMIGQMFIIDGVLYGIKDRHIYSSKLQLAYDLYKCKLLSTNYLNEPYRFFTNNFGNTQSIKYNPKQPKRLFIIDNANLLWCPVKLVKTDTNEIWHQSPTIVADQKLST